LKKIGKKENHNPKNLKKLVVHGTLILLYLVMTTNLVITP